MANFSRSKTIVFVRHGRTEMNEIMDALDWNAPGYVDAELWDTRLTEFGVSQACQLNANFVDELGRKFDVGSIQLLVSSPLKRALHTAELVYNNLIADHVPRLAHPLFRERLYMSSEVGKQKHLISEEHPEWNYDHLPDNKNWWYDPTPEEAAAIGEWRRPKGVYAWPGEPEAEFRDRIIEARQWLLSRPEDTIGVVSHWATLMAMTGRSFDNCEMVVLKSEDLLEEPRIVD